MVFFILSLMEITSVITNSHNSGAEAGGEEDDGQDEPGGDGPTGRLRGAGDRGERDPPPDPVRQSRQGGPVALAQQESQVSFTTNQF